MRKAGLIFFILIIAIVGWVMGTTGNLFWVTSTQGTPTNFLGTGNGNGTSPNPNVDPLVFPSEYLIYSRQGLDIGGSALIKGSVSLQQGYPMAFSGSKEFIQKNLDVEDFGAGGQSAFNDLYKSYVGSDAGEGIRQRPFAAPVCCSNCEVSGAFVEVDDDFTVSNKEVTTVSTNTYYKDELFISNGGTLKVLSGSVGSVLYLLIKELTIKGDLVIEGFGTVVIKVTETLIIEGDVYWNTFPNVNPNTQSNSNNLLILFEGHEYSQNGGNVNAVLCFSDAVAHVKLAGNMVLNGALSAPQADFDITGTVRLSKWLYGKTFKIYGNVEVYP